MTVPHLHSAASPHRKPSHVESAFSAVDAATRLISETAHDIRSPLATIRESIRLVHDGEFGQISPEQQGNLSSALDQCDCVDQLVGEMVQADRLRSGLPRVHRQSVSVLSVRDAVNETLRPWVIPRSIEILWDGADDPNLAIFADATMLRRLIVNLITNAIRATPDGEMILVRLENVHGGEAVRWSVIDQGAGMDEAELHEIAEQSVSRCGSDGLGLIICRQLAALQFSALHIRSRRHTGTEMTFETPIAGASSVAECWARWRISFRQPRQRPNLSEGSNLSDAGRSGHHRLDQPIAAIELRHNASIPRAQDQSAAGTVAVGAALPVATADEFDRLLQSQQRPFDLIYRIEARTWVWLLDEDRETVGERMQFITDRAQQQIHNLRLTWSPPRMIPIDACRTARRLSDLLVRQSLSASTATAADRDEVRLGTTPLEPSPVASARLDAELSRLIARFSRQTRVLQQQAVNLRPLPSRSAVADQ